MKRSYFKRKIGKPMRRTRLKKVSVNDSAQVKKDIQEYLRQIVILRDGGCIFRNRQRKTSYMSEKTANGLSAFIGIEAPNCNGYAKDGHLILQADHLITRGNSATFADSRLVVCLCKGHHGWKSVGNNMRKAEYDKIVKTLLPKERVELWERCEQDLHAHKSAKVDMKLALLALKQEYQQLQ